MSQALVTDAPARVARKELDYYPTDAHVVQAVLPFLPHALTVLDPACGVGEILRAVGPAQGVGIEIDAGRCQQARCAPFVDDCIHGDALKLDWPNASLVIMNPPYTHAQAFIEKALAWRAEDPRRTVACLARLTILESESRRELHQRNPSDVYVLAKRPTFSLNRHGKPGTDSVTACWLVWSPGGGGRWRVL